MLPNPSICSQRSGTFQNLERTSGASDEVIPLNPNSRHKCLPKTYQKNNLSLALSQKKSIPKKNYLINECRV